MVEIVLFTPLMTPQFGMFTQRLLLHCSQLPQSKLLEHSRRDELEQLLSLRQMPLRHSWQLPQSKSLKHARSELAALLTPQFGMFTHWLLVHRRQVPHCESVVQVGLQFEMSSHRLLLHRRQVPHCESVVQAGGVDD